MPNHYDYRELRLNPSAVKKKFKDQDGIECCIPDKKPIT